MKVATKFSILATKFGNLGGNCYLCTLEKIEEDGKPDIADTGTDATAAAAPDGVCG